MKNDQEKEGRGEEIQIERREEVRKRGRKDDWKE